MRREGRGVKTLRARFEAKVDRRGPDECWPWTAGRDSDGYGMIKVEGRIHTASRVAFFLAHGRWPTETRHTCHVRLCCNPAHLVDGTHAENMAGLAASGRKKGKGRARSLDEATRRKVLKLRESGMLLREIAACVGSTFSTIQRECGGRVEA
jgi:hypothetical protein